MAPLNDSSDLPQEDMTAGMDISDVPSTLDEDLRVTSPSVDDSFLSNATLASSAPFAEVGSKVLTFKPGSTNEGTRVPYQHQPINYSKGADFHALCGGWTASYLINSPPIRLESYQRQSSSFFDLMCRTLYEYPILCEDGHQPMTGM